MPVSEKEALGAVKTLIEWIGDDPDREGLQKTPARVIKALAEYYQGYDEVPETHLQTVFSEIEAYDGMIALKKIPFRSHCEHHMAPFEGFVSVAYLPNDHVVGLSKLARLVAGYSKRLQIQERLTAQIGKALETSLQPRGVAVRITAQHSCMSKRGIKADGWLTTEFYAGEFKTDRDLRREFLTNE